MINLEPAEPGDDVDVYDIVGESNYQDALRQLCGAKREFGVDEYCVAILHLEPQNPYDKNAVRCEISGLKVGYLGRDDAKDFRRYMRRRKLASMRVTANVRGGWKNSTDEGHFGVTIEVAAALIG